MWRAMCWVSGGRGTREADEGNRVFDHVRGVVHGGRAVVGALWQSIDALWVFVEKFSGELEGLIEAESVCINAVGEDSGDILSGHDEVSVGLLDGFVIVGAEGDDLVCGDEVEPLLRRAVEIQTYHVAGWSKSSPVRLCGTSRG